jgi:opacity protein-like surface antigen
MKARNAALGAWLILPLAPAAMAQGRAGVELAPFVGYRFGGGVTDAQTGAGASLDGAAAFGVIADVPLRPGVALEVLLSRQRTGVDLERYPQTRHFVLDVDHMLAGVRAGIPTDSASVHPFLAAYLGLTRFSGDSGAIADDTRFTAALGGGVLLDVTPHLGVRLDARGYAVFVSSAGGLFCTGGGCSGVFGGRAMLQGEVAAGLVLKL